MARTRKATLEAKYETASAQALDLIDRLQDKIAAHQIESSEEGIQSINAGHVDYMNSIVAQLRIILGEKN